MAHEAPVNLRYHNRIKVLLVYLLALILMAAPCAALFQLYPTLLAGSAPDLTPTVQALPQTLAEGLRGTLEATAVTAGMTKAELLAALSARDRFWLQTVVVFILCAAALSLLCQLVWRALRMRSRQTADATLVAISAYHRAMLIIWALNLALALLLYLVGVRWIAGRTATDYALYFSGFLVNPLAMIPCFRWAAPPSLSGRRAFFKRL